MAHPKAAWGIEIGAHAIKAIRLEREGSEVAVSDFAVIPHKKVLTTPDLDQDELVRLSLGQFISQKSLEGEHLVMSVPGHAAFARFAKLPPVEPKKIPDIVKFEAVQQIPFPIDEVEWDYQTFASDDSPEVEVGIFAITRERVKQRLGLYGEIGVTPESLTLSPLAVYNAIVHDYNLESTETGPLVFLDIGTQATDVIVVEPTRCWIRTFPLGGTHFTEAIASAFKLSYSKADKLKREAATSKYAKQIMQAMRPVFSDLLQDLQRSIGYYNNLHRDNELTSMVGIGSTFKIPGLRKFLGQQLQINVIRLDEFKRIHVTGREAASFSESTVNMATAYGLALQGVGMARISANLVPLKALRDQMWHSKTKWFAAAAAIVIVGAAMSLYRPLTDRGALEAGSGPPIVDEVLADGKRLKQQFNAIQGSSEVGYATNNVRNLFDDRTIWPYLVSDVSSALHSTQPQPELFTGNEEKILKIDPKDRRLVQLDKLTGQYVPPATAQETRRIQVRMEVQLSHEQWDVFLNDTVASWLRDHAEPEGERGSVPYRILNVKINPSEVQFIDVTAEGDVVGASSPVRPPSGSPSGPKPPSGRPPGPATGGGGGGGGSGSGMGAGPGAGMGAGPGGGGSKPQRPKRPPRQVPGSGLGGGLGGGTGSPGMGPGGGGGGTGKPTSPSSPTGTGSGFGKPERPGSGSPGSPIEPEIVDVNAVAPLPSKPKFYPTDSRYYRVPITFEIELIDPSAAARSVSTAWVDVLQEGETS